MLHPTKHVTRQNHFVIAKFKKLRILTQKTKKKNSGIISLTELLTFAIANNFFQLNFFQIQPLKLFCK